MSKCEGCRQTCKNQESSRCKFFPKESLLGYPIHFKETPDRFYGKHERTSRICVVCKEYFNLAKIKWWKGKAGAYSFCLDCWKRHLFIAKYAKIAAT